MKENWKSIKDYEGLYEASDLGRVRSLKFGKVKVLKPGNNGNGYLHAVLYKDGKKEEFYLQRLVVETFRGPIPAGMQINHLNEDKSDNRLVNLEICTAQQNCNWGTRNERIAKELKLTNASTCAKYTFTSSYEASEFFGYARKNQIGNYIFNARKRGKNFINIRREKYYFSQSA